MSTATIQRIGFGPKFFVDCKRLCNRQAFTSRIRDFPRYRQNRFDQAKQFHDQKVGTATHGRKQRVGGTEKKGAHGKLHGPFECVIASCEIGSTLRAYSKPANAK